MKLFLCSHFSSVGSLIKEEIENKKVAFIPTASLREGYTGYVGSARKLFKKLGAIVTEIDISTEAYSTIQSVFEDADVIYFTGGNSFFLMDQLRKTRTDGLLKKELVNGKLMIGESAGAIICAPSIQYIEQMDEKPEDYSQEDDARCVKTMRKTVPGRSRNRITCPVFVKSNAQRRITIPSVLPVPPHLIIVRLPRQRNRQPVSVLIGAREIR